ncbi:hypothetical protein EDD76_108147 [Kineothrix alysoides]|uniref:Uncharacterized protein n=1 Tax=Kineothrix alysoides TaxID=1469948 RepID=A0A4V2QBS7_9FIRM|nr:hypothetical protein [Kineothrix alysoides]TCL57612.1 hypothetical protein EDD76_108147 [Kineothrix alysoides]
MKLKDTAKKIKYAIRTSILIISLFSLSLTAFASNAPSAQMKEEYYQEYLTIVSEISEEVGIPMRVIPAKEFQDDQWITPEEFRASISASAAEIAAAEFIVSDSETTEPIKGGISPRSTAIKTKTGSISANNKTYKISVTGTFTTQYNASANRQVFSGVSKVTSTSADAGLWSQISYDYYFADTHRTACVTATGWWKPQGSTVEYNRGCFIEFYCNSNGSVS